MSQEVTLVSRASRLPWVFRTVPDQRQTALMLGELGSGCDFLPPQRVQGLAASAKNEHRHPSAQAGPRKGPAALKPNLLLLVWRKCHSMGIYFFTPTSHHFVTLGNSVRGTEENPKYKQEGHNVAEWLRAVSGGKTWFGNYEPYGT